MRAADRAQAIAASIVITIIDACCPDATASVAS
jgi:hypothetical protein